jgi:hypothetical protein
VADPPTGGGWPPLRLWGWLSHPRPAGLVVAEPPQWPKGVGGPPPVKGKKKHERRRVADPPIGGGWPPLRPAGHPHGLSCGQPPLVGGSATLPLSRFFFFFFNRGWSSHPLWVDQPPFFFHVFILKFLDLKF